jgi:hypothetical protein
MNTMTVFSKLIVASAFAVFTSSAFAQANQAIPKKTEVKLANAKTHQRCMQLNPPQKVSYDFNATDKVNFQIRYQKRDTPYFPVKLNRVTTGSDVFTPSTNDEYCMIWENRSGKDVTLSFSYSVFK